MATWMGEPVIRGAADAGEWTTSPGRWQGRARRVPLAEMFGYSTRLRCSRKGPPPTRWNSKLCRGTEETCRGGDNAKSTDSVQALIRSRQPPPEGISQWQGQISADQAP